MLSVFSRDALNAEVCSMFERDYVFDDVRSARLAVFHACEVQAVRCRAPETA
jgi:hypothetical protein